ncbi:MAG: class II aldolase/adducin family protein [Burkholderiales bacterium]|nr:class II aldolase/adducin family protein [Burkholderiales bacterium]
MPAVTESRQRRVRLAARALARHGLVHAYGHCSERIDDDRFLVCAARPMGLIKAGEGGAVVPIHGELPEAVLEEVRVHQAIYARRADVRAVVRSMPGSVMALGTARLVPQPRHGFGTYFVPSIALWDDPQLVRSPRAAASVAELMGAGSALVMRGNGAIVCADSLAKAVVLTWYLEDAAKLELMVRSAGLSERSVVISESECAIRAVSTGLIFERMWDYLCAGDPEAGNI